jgi:hypothetical protein
VNVNYWGAVLKRPGIRGSRGGDVAIERCGRNAKAMCNLSDADVGIGERRLGDLDAVVRKFRRTASGTASASRCKAGF